jgi:hypothetical protein
MADPIPFDIVQQADRRVASNGRATLSLLDAGGQVFRRRAVKGAGTPDARRVEWVVAELDGVRVYFDGTHVVVSKQDLTP